MIADQRDQTLVAIRCPSQTLRNRCHLSDLSSFLDFCCFPLS
jgi:hypothetical protein